MMTITAKNCLPTTWKAKVRGLQIQGLPGQNQFKNNVLARLYLRTKNDKGTECICLIKVRNVMCACTCMCICGQARTCTWQMVKTRDRHWVSSSVAFHWAFGMRSVIGPGTTELTRLSGQRAPGILLYQPPEHRDCECEPEQHGLVGCHLGPGEET